MRFDPGTNRDESTPMPTELKDRIRPSRIKAIIDRVLPVAQAMLMLSAATLVLMIVIQLEISSWAAASAGGPLPIEVISSMP
jgi:hypothetical protein